MLRECDEHAVLAQDASLLGGDGAERVAEELGVVDADVSDDRQLRVDDVGGVEATAEADLEDGDIDALLRVIAERDSGEEFEKAGRMREFAVSDERGGRGVDECEENGKVVVGNLVELGGFAVGKLDALVDAEQVGRGVEAGAKTGSAEDRGERGGGRTLAVGAGDEHGAEGAVRVPERVQQSADVVERPLARSAGSASAQFGTHAGQARQGFFVGHFVFRTS